MFHVFPGFTQRKVEGLEKCVTHGMPKSFCRSFKQPIQENNVSIAYLTVQPQTMRPPLRMQGYERVIELTWVAQACFVH